MLRVCKKPMLGISSGMQLMSTFVKEENLSCLGIFHGTTEKFLDKSFKNQRANINEVIFIKESRLFDNLKIEERFFFDNQFYLPVDKNTIAVSGQVPIISAAIEKNNFFGLQFLPEKSGEAGIQIIKNFAQL
jgi:glutamine amidotransferase